MTVRRLRVLLAEDQPVNRLLATRILERHGHEVVCAEDGRDALWRLGQETFDVVLMDVQMPIMDGFEATAAIRELERGTGRHVPVIALTASDLAGDREHCLASGMDSYASKPFKPMELMAAIEAAVSGGEPGTPEARSA